ncbi:MAG: 30S ribosomal protein S8 [Elusimicrobia bacterium RIFCSPLOWO2_01_FULL_54_10]|nr:MAG: 30S ribosomal protein S8 [Elusimicrobia bacterium RIFCSPLOWO2_01_FULL_54_10]
MDPIADFLTSIRNASAKGHEKTDIPFSKMKVNLAKVLKDEGYISGYRMMEENRVPFLRIQLKYTDTKQPIITGIQRVSRPGLRIYEKSNTVKQVDGGMGIAIVSTSKGLMTHKKARAAKCGGEVLCNVW